MRFLPLCWLSLLLLITGCSSQGPKSFINFQNTEASYQAVQTVSNEVIQPLRIAVSSTLPYRDTIGYYRQIAEHLAIQTGHPTEVIQRQSNTEVSVLLANGGADIAFFSTGTYVAYSNLPAIEALVMQQRNGVPFYYSYIVVPKDSKDLSLSDLQGKSFAFTDSLSYSGYLSPSYLLLRDGFSPDQFFSRYFFTYSHTKSLRAVADHVVDGAAIDSLAYEYAKKTSPEIADAVRIIWTSMPIGTGPVVVRKDMREEQKELIRSIFLNMHRNADMALTLKGLLIDRFVTPKPEYYEYPVAITTEMRIR